MQKIITSAKGKQFEIPDYTPKQLKVMFRPYAEQIGFLVANWNTLHEHLPHVFSIILKTSDRDEMAMAIWHSTDSDFLQRKMLRSVVKNAKIAKEKRDAILWIIDKIDESLRHRRNDAIHAPWIFMTGIVNDALSSWFAADLFSLNP